MQIRKQSAEERELRDSWINDDDPVAHLEPGGEENPLESPPVYNPLKNAYAMVLDEVNVEITVMFSLERTNRRTHIEFTDSEGEQHSIPFFPVASADKVDECGEPVSGGVVQDYSGSQSIRDMIAYNSSTRYEGGESPYYVVPMIVRAKVASGENAGNLLTRDQLIMSCPPDRLERALDDYYQSIVDDNQCPPEVVCLFGAATGRHEVPASSYDDWGDEEDDGDGW